MYNLDLQKLENTQVYNLFLLRRDLERVIAEIKRDEADLDFLIIESSTKRYIMNDRLGFTSEDIKTGSITYVGTPATLRGSIIKHILIGIARGKLYFKYKGKVQERLMNL